MAILIIYRFKKVQYFFKTPRGTTVVSFATGHVMGSEEEVEREKYTTYGQIDERWTLLD